MAYIRETVIGVAAGIITAVIWVPAWDDALGRPCTLSWRVVLQATLLLLVLFLVALLQLIRERSARVALVSHIKAAGLVQET